MGFQDSAIEPTNNGNTKVACVLACGGWEWYWCRCKVIEEAPEMLGLVRVPLQIISLVIFTLNWRNLNKNPCHQLLWQKKEVQAERDQ